MALSKKEAGRCLAALDIETKCKLGCETSCDHALVPHMAEFTIAAIVNDHLSCVFESAEELNQFLVSNPNIGFVGHNFKYDYQVMHWNGIELPLDRWDHDTMNMMHTCTDKIPDDWLANYEAERKEINNTIKGTHRAAKGKSLKTNAPYWLGVKPFWEDPTNHASGEYVLKDTKYTWELFKLFTSKLKERGEYDFYYDWVMPRDRMLTEISIKGFPINVEAVKRRGKQIETEIKEVKARLDATFKDAADQKFRDDVTKLRNKYLDMWGRQCAKETQQDPAERRTKLKRKYFKLYRAKKRSLEYGISYGSPTQLMWLLRDHLGYDVSNVVGKESTDKEVLHKLAAQGKPGLDLLLQYRQLNKILTSYIPAYLELADDNGLLHPQFNISGTRTGRLSSSKPNLQQVPPGLYEDFGHGGWFADYDYGSIEAVLIALYTEDKSLFNLVDQGISIHNANAKYAVFPDKMQKVLVENVKKEFPKERQAAKGIGFAIFYNAGATRVRGALAGAGIDISKVEANNVVKRIREKYRTAREFVDQITKVGERGEVVYNLLGRPLRIQNPDDAYMKMMNTLIQSSASDLLLDAALPIHNELKSRAPSARIVALIHDAIIVYAASKADAEMAEDIMKEHLTKYKLRNRLGKLELTIEGGVSSVWSK